MENQALLHADYLDILFDHRNKKYGGYELRKNYSNRMGKAALYALSAITLLSIYFYWSNLHTGGAIVKPIIIPTTFTSRPVEIDPPKPKTIEHVQPPATQPVKTEVFAPKIVDDHTVVPGKELTKIPEGQPGDHPVDGPPGPPAQPHVATPGPETVSVPAPPAAIKRYAEVMPAFIGDMGSYLDNHLHYPTSASEAGIEGRVIVEFLINEDGSVTNVHIARGIGGGCDEEALKIVSGMPKWKPGMQNGSPVKVLFTLPIKFVLK